MFCIEKSLQVFSTLDNTTGYRTDYITFSLTFPQFTAFITSPSVVHRDVINVHQCWSVSAVERRNPSLWCARTKWSAILLLIFSSAQLITSLPGDTMNSCHDTQVVMGNKNGSLMVCDVSGCVKFESGTSWSAVCRTTAVTLQLII